MSYHLLTGATGLLGCYLLRDCAAEDVRLAIVARPTKRQTARQRVESIMARWEQDLGHSLPRPVVLEGDLTEPRIGLASEDLKWIAGHCSAVIHNAASLTFVKTKDGEPYRSNVDGTRHVLQVCRETGLRRFFHVSTAYVCGLRQGRVLETELDVGQHLGNDYEQSKIESEKMVVQADYLDPPTVFRPGIITGDAKSGFTSTFHGFYSPLRIAFALVERISESTDGPIDVEYASSLLELFGLNGAERKNFVPVDWVSLVMTSVIARPELHGRVYHLTPAKRVTISEMVDVMFQAICERMAQQRPRPSGRPISIELFEEFFQQQLSVYRSYWRDDPEFDRTNTTAVAPTPAPEISRETMLNLCRYAIEAKFGSATPSFHVDPFDVEQRVKAKVTGRAAGGVATTAFLGLQVNGEGGGQWELELHEGSLAAARNGLSSRCSARLYLNSRSFQHLCKPPGDVWEALRNGSVLVEGNGLTLEQIAGVLESVTHDAVG